MSRKKEYRFVIQEHNAKKAGLHYDLRIEDDKGKLESWFMPKSPPPDKYKSTNGVYAQKTNTHNMKWADFEGKIPDGKYGAGTVKIWDKGKVIKTHEGKHNLVFIVIQGQKLKGRKYVLHKLHYQNWILFRAKVKPYEKRTYLENFMEGVSDTNIGGMLDKVRDQEGIQSIKRAIDRTIFQFETTHKKVKKIKVVSWLNELIDKMNEIKKKDIIMQESFEYFYRNIIKFGSSIPKQNNARQIFINEVGNSYSNYDPVIRNLYFKNFYKISYIYEYYYILQRLMLLSSKHFRYEKIELYNKELKEIASFNSFVNRELYMVFSILSYYIFRKMQIDVTNKSYNIRRFKSSYIELKKYLYDLDWFDSYPFKKERLDNLNSSIIFFLFNLQKVFNENTELFYIFKMINMYFFKMIDDIRILLDKSYSSINNETYKEFFIRGELFDNMFNFLYNIRYIDDKNDIDDSVPVDTKEKNESDDYIKDHRAIAMEYIENIFFDDSSKKYKNIKIIHKDFMKKLLIRYRTYNKNLTLTKENF